MALFIADSLYFHSKQYLYKLIHKQPNTEIAADLKKGRVDL